MNNYSKIACPNTSCSFYAKFNSGNIAHRSWTGKNREIERLRCICCKQEFSERKATLMENAKLSEKTYEQMLKCLRWGVCDEGIADICDVSIKTVRLNQNKAAAKAVKHHDSAVQNLQDAGTQLDEMHCKIAKDKGFWLGTAIAMQSLLIVAITFGERNQALADRLLAEVNLRFTRLMSIFTDGWRLYLSAILRAFGTLYRPKQKGRGRPLHRRLKLPDLFYGQVVKLRDEALKLVGVEHRALIGKMREIIFFIKTYHLGNKIHTIHAERWYGTLRCCLACCRRRTRCPSKSRKRQKQKIWIYVSLYNWVINHSSLTRGKTKKTPAMAAGLIEYQLSYRDYIWLRVYDDGYNWREKLSKKVMIMNEEKMLSASRRIKIKPEKAVVMQLEEVAA